MPSSWTCRDFSRWMGKTQETVEATLVMERNLNQAFLDLHSLGSACADSHLRGFLEPLPRQGESVKKMGEPSDQSPQVGWFPGCVGWGSLKKAHPQSWLGASRAWGPLKSCCECQDFCLKPLAAANRQFSNHSGDLSQRLDQMETIQLFAENNNNNNNFHFSKLRDEKKNFVNSKLNLI